ncbi:MAG TPA: FecR domain-containing protein, partial [Stellaceae bacterium]|nr:FecR domain-containing protein [Stellaceae bacterium]
MPRPCSLTPRVAALVISALLAFTSGADAQQRVGVNSAVNPDVSGLPPGAPARQLVLGGDVVFKERITTNLQGQTQVLFLDKSAMTVGPSSDVTIDEFVYDPNTGSGKLAMSAAHGVMRFIGGKLSKNGNAVSLLTPTGVLAVRGGIFLAAIGSQGTDVTFLYGDGLTVSNPAGSQVLTRPGYMVTVASRNMPPSEPRPAPPGATAALLSQLDGRSGGTGGAQRTPTDQTVVSSGIASTISGNVVANVLAASQASAQQQPTRSQPPATNASAVQTS